MTIRVLSADGVPASPARVRASSRPPFRVGAVQHRWHPDEDEHRAALDEGIAAAAGAGARLVCLMELTLSRYFAVDAAGPGAVTAGPEPLEAGPTFAFAAAAARRHGVHVHASLWEADPAIAPRGWNTAICVAPDGSLVGRTRKVHIPVTAGYHEDRYFPPGDTGFPVHRIDGAAVGLPTCWDQWFPELARAYALQGAELLVYPTAIGSEPDHPGFDTQPLWQQVMVGHAIANGLFVIAVNRIGTEPGPDPEHPGLSFYGSSFIADPYGRVLVEAPRDEPAVLVADLDLDQRRDWLDLFPFLDTRRPELYGLLADDQQGLLADDQQGLLADDQ
jgi:N-carbamoylputrescine amidase